MKKILTGTFIMVLSQTKAQQTELLGTANSFELLPNRIIVTKTSSFGTNL